MRWRRSPSFWAAVGGIVAGLLLAGSVAVPVHGVGTSTSPSAPPHPAASFDPEFLPAVLTDPTDVDAAYAEFGTSVAASGDVVAVGAPYDYAYPYSGHVYLYNTSTGANASIPNPRCCDTEFGGAVALDSQYLVVGAPAAEYFYSYAGTVFVFSATTHALVAQLNSSNPTLEGRFGTSVAISGSTIVVGAPGENESGDVDHDVAAGHAYIINLKTHTTTMLSSPNPREDGGFGVSVAISGTTVVVGAPEENHSGPTTGGASSDIDAGNAYVFSSSSGDLIQTLTAPCVSTESDFGVAVAVNGSTVVVGQPVGADVPFGCNLGGSADEFDLATGSNTTLTSPQAMIGGEFGASVAVDSLALVVGAPYEYSGSGEEDGDAYLFTVGAGEQASSTFEPPDWPDYGQFGSTVAVGGSGAVVGAPFEPAGNLEDAGHAYIFSKIPLTYTAAPNGENDGSGYGASVAANTGVFAIGAPGDNEVDLFFSETGTEVVIHGPGGSGDFGASVALTGTYLLVGAPAVGEYLADGLYLYTINATLGSIQYDGLMQLGDGGPVGAGNSLGASDGLSGSWLVVGAPGHSPGYVRAQNISDAPYGTVNLTLPSYVSSGARFGASVGISGTLVVVGSPGQNESNGSAYLYNVSGSGKLLFQLDDPVQGQHGDFGSSVSISGNTVVVGAPNNTLGGAVYVFSAKTGQLEYTLVDPNPASGGRFGDAVSTNGATIVVGADNQTAFGTSGAGNIYLYGAGSTEAYERYNSPSPSANETFGLSVSVGPGGKVLAGDGPLPAVSSIGAAWLFFL